MAEAEHSDTPRPPEAAELSPEDLERIAGGEDESDAPHYEPVTPDPWETGYAS